MRNRGRTLKVTAALVLSALALTGFTTGRGPGGGSRHGGGGGGGGCSSSNQDHDSSSSSSSGGTYNRRPTHHSTPSSSPGGDQGEDAKAELVSCATKKAPYATVKATNSNAETGRFWVSVTFVDADGITITEESEEVKVSGKGRKTTRVEIGGEGLVDSVDHCEVDPHAIPVSG